MGFTKVALLKACDCVSGSAILFRENPKLSLEGDLLFYPWKSELSITDPHWGLYSQGGQLVESAAYNRLPTKFRMGQSGMPAGFNPRSVEVVTIPVIYGGPVILHYGHYIVSGLARLWTLVNAKRNGDERILVHSTEQPEFWFNHTFAGPMLRALGLAPDNFLVINKPVRLASIRIPGPAFEEQHFAHNVFDALCTFLGSNVPCETFSFEPTYISKTQMISANSRIVNEREIEDRMRSRRIRVVYPERLSFVNQVNLFRNSSAVLGSMSSAFHTSLFLDRPSRLIGLSPGREINSNFRLIDNLKDNISHYLYPTEGVNQLEPSELATFGCQIAPAEEVVRELLEFL